MSIPPLPQGLRDSEISRAANALHSLAIHVLRRARAADLASGLNPERLSLLSALVYGGPRRVGDLAAIEGVSMPAVSRTLTGLEKLGLAARRRDPTDARVVLAQATAKGKRLMEQGRRRRLEIVCELLARLDRREVGAVAAVGALLPKMVSNGQQATRKKAMGNRQ
jgi:DNA-binding MarR family transcriptional regulator